MTPEPVDLSIRRIRGVDVVQLSGDLDISNVAAVAARIAAETRTSEAIVVDVSRVPFLDSAGVRMLDELVAGTGRRHVGLRVVAPPRGTLRTVLRLTAFPKALLAPTVADAVAALER